MTDVTSGARETSVTIKYGKEFDKTWAVFRGNVEEIRSDLLAYFAVDAEAVAGLTLHELVVNCTKLAQGSATVAGLLGGTVIPASSSPAPGSGGTAFDEPAAPAQPEAPAVNPLLAVIEAQTDVDGLKRVWAENQAAFADAELMAAWKARGKALQGVAA